MERPCFKRSGSLQAGKPVVVIWTADNLNGLDPEYAYYAPRSHLLK